MVNNMQKIYFRADASATIGYGHFIRTLALADMLKDDFDCTFYTVSPTEYQVGEMERVCRWVALNAESHFNDFVNLLHGDEIVVLDNYFYSTEHQVAIKDRGCKLVVMDDLHNQHNVADVIINHGVDNAEVFDVEPYTKLCLGLGWALLRRPFLRAHHNSIRRKLITVCFGGSDQLDLTGKAIKQCLETYPDYTISAVVGDKYSPIDGYINHDKVSYLSKLSDESLAALFYESEFVICSASTISIEAIFCGAKVAAGWYVDNQIDYYNNLVDLGYFIPLGYIGGDFVLPDLSMSTKSLSVRCDIHNHYFELFKQLSSGTYLRHVRQKDVDILYKWANDPLTRKNSFNSDPIEYSIHCAWFKKMINRDDVLMYILVHNGNMAGNVRLNIESGVAEIGCTIAPSYRGKGLGNLIIDLISREAVFNGSINKLIARVKETNLPSRLMLEKNGFIQEDSIPNSNSRELRYCKVTKAVAL